MKKTAAYFLVLFITLGTVACKSSKKIQKSVGVVTPTKTIAKDTPAAIIPVVAKIDSVQWSKAIIDSNKTHLLPFKTLKAKLNVSLKSSFLNQDVSAALRIRRDSAIWIALTGPFGIEGARVLINRDSVWVMNKLNKTVERHAIAYLQNIIHIPVGFPDVQNILIGGILLPNARYKSIVYNNIQGSIILEKLLGNIINRSSILNKDWKVQSQNITDSRATNGRRCMITNSNFEEKNGHYFPQKIDIEATEGNNKVTVGLQYKQYTINEEITFPFDIPSSYKLR